MPVPPAFVDHFFPPTFFLPFTFLGLPFGHPPLKCFRALLAFEKCSAPCNSRVRLPPFLPIMLAAVERGEGFFGFMVVLFFHHTAIEWCYEYIFRVNSRVRLR